MVTSRTIFTSEPVELNSVRIIAQAAADQKNLQVTSQEVRQVFLWLVRTFHDAFLETLGVFFIESNQNVRLYSCKWSPSLILWLFFADGDWKARQLEELYKMNQIFLQMK